MIDANQKTDSTKPTIGVVAISYNEECDLPRFLEHLIPWVDEIVVVDDGSNDRTSEIANAAGPKVKFIVSPREEGEYYSHQRNKGIEAATSDWLLHMDIDERVTPELAQEIRIAINNPTKDAYRYRRLNYFLHRPMLGGAWQNWNLVHLAKRDIFHFEGMFHEKCICETTSDRIGQLSKLMHHLNDESYDERLRKSRNYVEEIANNFGKRKKPLTAPGVVYYPIKEFVYRYFYKLGFRDGGLGILSALHSATAVFRGCFLAWDRQNRIDRQELESKLAQQWRSSSLKD